MKLRARSGSKEPIIAARATTAPSAAATAGSTPRPIMARQARRNKVALPNPESNSPAENAMVTHGNSSSNIGTKKETVPIPQPRLQIPRKPKEASPFRNVVRRLFSLVESSATSLFVDSFMLAIGARIVRGSRLLLGMWCFIVERSWLSTRYLSSADSPSFARISSTSSQVSFIESRLLRPTSSRSLPMSRRRISTCRPSQRTGWCQV